MDTIIIEVINHNNKLNNKINHYFQLKKQIKLQIYNQFDLAPFNNSIVATTNIASFHLLLIHLNNDNDASANVGMPTKHYQYSFLNGPFKVTLFVVSIRHSYFTINNHMQYILSCYA